MLDILTTPQPTWVHGATGETGVVPESGSHVVNDGYQADKFSALRTSELRMVKDSPSSVVPLTRYPPRAVDAPEPPSLNSSRNPAE